MKNRWTRSPSRSRRPACVTSAATSSATRPRSTTSSFRTAGRRATWAPRTPHAYPHCHSTRTSCGSSCSRTAARRLSRSIRRRPPFRSMAESASSAGREAGSARCTAPTKESPCVVRLARTRARFDTRWSSTTRPCSPPAPFAPRCRNRASRSTDRRGWARRRVARSRWRLWDRHRSRRSSAKWIVRASTSTPSYCSARPRTPQDTSARLRLA